MMAGRPRIEVFVVPVSPVRLLDRTEAAAALGVTPRTVTELVRRGELSAYRFAGRPRFHRADVLALRDTRWGPPAQDL